MSQDIENLEGGWILGYLDLFVFYFCILRKRLHFLPILLQ